MFFFVFFSLLLLNCIVSIFFMFHFMLDRAIGICIILSVHHLTIMASVPNILSDYTTMKVNDFLIADDDKLHFGHSISINIHNWLEFRSIFYVVMGHPLRFNEYTSKIFVFILITLLNYKYVNENHQKRTFISKFISKKEHLYKLYYEHESVKCFWIGWILKSEFTYIHRTFFTIKPFYLYSKEQICPCPFR